jgi:hypothetical protein
MQEQVLDRLAASRTLECRPRALAFGPGKGITAADNTRVANRMIGVVHVIFLFT